MKFTPSTIDDLPQIIEWTALDPFHCNVNTQPEWWLTGNDCIIAFCAEDESGPVMYVRMDDEGQYARLHVQFAPEDVVNKRRVARTLAEGFPKLAELARDAGNIGVCYESESPLLIRFLAKLGFKFISGKDYRADFQE